MYQFDLTQEPLTNLELKSERENLKVIRKEQIKYSCISDVSHSVIFIALYFNQMLSGYAVLAAIGLSTICALGVATMSRQPSKLSNRIAISVIAGGTAAAVTTILVLMMKQSLSGGIIAGLLTGSIIVVGGTLGRKIKEVIVAIEDLKPISDDTHAQQELAALCHQFSKLADYREQATSYLRPTLTYGELKAMRNWTEE